MTKIKVYVNHKLGKVKRHIEDGDNKLLVVERRPNADTNHQLCIIGKCKAKDFRRK